jgi:flagellar biosynthesis/type III secretory pathway protein FliH
MENEYGEEYQIAYDRGYRQGSDEGYETGYEDARQDLEERIRRLWAETITLNARIDYVVRMLDQVKGGLDDYGPE